MTYSLDRQPVLMCPGVSELPPPPWGKTGWPWAQEENGHFPGSLPDGSPWPRVSIVTPSFNQAPYIEETIRSVLLQGYPNLEYIVIDGGSTDGSLEIIRKYEKHLARVVSEPDRGQCHAINKGWKLSTGQVLAYLPSDDLYLPGAIQASVCHLHEHRGQHLVYGYAHHIDEQGSVFNLLRPPRFDLRRLLESCFIVQPTVFFRRSLLERIGYLDESIYNGMDYDYWLRASAVTVPALLPRFTAAARYHPDAKGVAAFNEFFRTDLRTFDQMFVEGDRSLPKGSLARTAYLPRLLYIAGLFSGFTNEERADALVRLERVHPLPTVRELVFVIRWYGSMLDSPYLGGTQGDHAVGSRSEDSFGIIRALLAAGLIGESRAARVRGLVHAHSSLRELESGRGDLTPARVYRSLGQIALRHPGMLTTRPFWAGAARSTPLGQRLLPAYYRARDGGRWLLDMPAWRSRIRVLRALESERHA